MEIWERRRNIATSVILLFRNITFGCFPQSSGISVLLRQVHLSHLHYSSIQIRENIPISKFTPCVLFRLMHNPHFPNTTSFRWSFVLFRLPSYSGLNRQIVSMETSSVIKITAAQSRLHPTDTHVQVLDARIRFCMQDLTPGIWFMRSL